MQGMIGNSTHSTWDACYISCASSGRTKCQTQKSKNVPMGMACTSSFANPGPISKDLLYGELVEDSRLTGCPCLCYKDVCKRDLKACNINTDMWETSAEDLSTWCITVAGVYMKLRRQGLNISLKRDVGERILSAASACVCFYRQHLYQGVPFVCWIPHPLAKMPKKIQPTLPRHLSETDRWRLLLKQRKQKKLVESKDCFCRGQWS